MKEQQAEIHTLAGAYALDALPPDEERFFEAHLAECASCRHEVAELRATAAVLGAGAAEEPPEGLRARVMAEVDVTRQEPPLTDDAAAAQETRAARLKRALASVAAAAVIAIVGLTAVVANLGSRLDELEDRSGEVVEVLAASDVRSVELRADGTSARLIIADASGKAVFLAQGLAEAPPGKVYELWLIHGEQPTPAGLFNPDSDGGVVHVLAGDITSADAVAVTIEPAGGSPQPTTDPIMVTTI